jgi:hypothetical protein
MLLWDSIMMPQTGPPSPPNVTPVEPIARVLDKEWTCLSGARPNVLLVGDRAATRAGVSDLQSTYQRPIAEWTCGGRPLVLPATESVRTIILHDVAELSLGEQQILSDWLSRENGGRTQLVTTTSVRLFPLVMSGAFLAALYYRLNVIYVEV